MFSRRIIKAVRLGTGSVLVRGTDDAAAPGPDEGQAVQQAPEVAPSFEELEAQAWARAAAAVNQGRRQAEQILNEARERAAEVRLQAYQEGFNQGVEDGRTEALREMEEALNLVRRTAREAKQIRDRIIANSERQIVELVLDAVRKVITTELDQNPKLVVDTVERAMKRAGNQRILRIRVNPGDEEAVRVAFLEDGTADWDVTPDDRISIGGCMVDTEAGVVDARLETQVGEIERTFLEMSHER